MRTYLTIFFRTFAGLALVALLAAQGADWTDTGDFAVTAQVLAFALLMAAIGGLIAALWAFVASPAGSTLGRSLRSAVQAFLGTPIAALVIDSPDDFDSLPELILPAVIAAVLAFAVTYLSNFAPAPRTEAVPAAEDFTVGAEKAGNV
jgi:ABC-type amino acid transport system permease subunit